MFNIIFGTLALIGLAIGFYFVSKDILKMLEENSSMKQLSFINISVVRFCNLIIKTSSNRIEAVLMTIQSLMRLRFLKNPILYWQKSLPNGNPELQPIAEMWRDSEKFKFSVSESFGREI